MILYTRGLQLKEHKIAQKFSSVNSYLWVQYASFILGDLEIFNKMSNRGKNIQTECLESRKCQVEGVV